MYRVRIKFSKEEAVKFISHRDLMRVLERAIRRTNIPIAYSQGFNPHQKISMSHPLPLGMTSVAEYADLYLDQPLSTEKILEELNYQLPSGIKVFTATVIPLGDPSLAVEVKEIAYQVSVGAKREQIRLKVEGEDKTKAKDIPSLFPVKTVKNIKRLEQYTTFPQTPLSMPYSKK